MVYIIFTNNGEYTFDRLADMLDAAEESARTEIHRLMGKVEKRGVSWNECMVYFEEGSVKKQFRLLDNGRDIYRTREGVLLEKMIPRFILEPQLNSTTN